VIFSYYYPTLIQRKFKYIRGLDREEDMSQGIQIPAGLLRRLEPNRYQLDLRGYTCPYPQLYTARALKEIEKDAILEILIDNPPSRETVPRTIRNNKQEYLGTETQGPGTWKILARKITD
jgi:Predicted redox protein, regulator of disulfide bond formation